MTPNDLKLAQNTPPPRIALGRQNFAGTQIGDPAVAAADAMTAASVDKIRPGMSIAITAGSRGIACLPEPLAAIVQQVRARGAHPFVVPAMGSHGGATAEGQTALLARLGVSEATIGCDIRSSMGTVEIGVLDNGMSVRMDRHAHGADGIVLFIRIKPHTSFRALVETGLAKMLAVGLGKQSGAETCHARGIDNVRTYAAQMAKMKLARRRVLFGIGTVENAHDGLSRVVVLDSDGMIGAEAMLPELRDRPGSGVIGELQDMRFEDGRLSNPWAGLP